MKETKTKEEVSPREKSSSNPGGEKIVTRIEDTIQFFTKRYNKTKSKDDAKAVDILRWTIQKEKKQSEGRLSWKYPIVMMLLMAFILEATGVNTGTYVYGGSLIKILGVPLYIPIMWSVIMTIAYIISRKYGVIVGVLSAYSIDLLLEPLAFYTGAWTWLNTFSAQVYFNSTVANAIVWLLMCLLGVYLWRKYSWRYDELKNKIPRPLRA